MICAKLSEEGCSYLGRSGHAFRFPGNSVQASVNFLSIFLVLVLFIDLFSPFGRGKAPVSLFLDDYCKKDEFRKSEP